MDQGLKETSWSVTTRPSIGARGEGDDEHKQGIGDVENRTRLQKETVSFLRRSGTPSTARSEHESIKQCASYIRKVLRMKHITSANALQPEG